MALARELSVFDQPESGDMGARKAKITPFAAMFKKVLGAFQNRQSESDIERYINAHGGIMTDEIERKISRRYGAMVD